MTPAVRQFIKIVVKISYKTGVRSSGSATRFISISKISYLELSNKSDLSNYINLCLNNFNKHIDKYSPIMPDGLIVEYLFVSKNEYNAGVSQKIVDFSPAGVFQFPLTTDYKSLSDKVSVKNVGLTKYYTYSKCKGLKNSENATFVVNNIHSDNTLEINNVTLDLNKLIYTFTDKLNKVTGEFSRSFSSSNQEVTNNFKTTLLNNKDSIDPIKNNGLNEEFNILTLDC